MNWLFTFVISSLIASSGVDVGSLIDKTTGDTCTPAAVYSAVQDETVRFEQTYPI
jgi:Na+-translocating ferredoxin:NAD+ oxidoreductase RnfG subunit